MCLWVSSHHLPLELYEIYVDISHIYLQEHSVDILKIEALQQFVTHCTISSHISSGTRAHTVSSWGCMLLSVMAHNLFFKRHAGHLKVSPSLNSFRTPLSNQSLLLTHIQNLCVVHGGINGEPLLMLSNKRMAWKTLLCKSWKRVATRVCNRSSLATVVQGSRREICPDWLLYVSIIWMYTPAHLQE